MSLLEKAPDWFVSGLCHGRPELAPLFFPDDENPAQCQEGRQYCQRCPVATQCRDYAITNEIHFGLWGGLTTRERERYRKSPATFTLRIVSCEECGKPLTGHKRMFCSVTCVRRAARRRNKQGQILPVNCRQCGKEFARHHPAQVMCGPECRKEALAERLWVKRAPQRIGCWTCNQPIERKNSRDKYCSDKCRAAARATQKSNHARGVR